MWNPFEKPRQEAPKDEESVDIDVSEFETPVEGGTRMETSETIAARHDELGRQLAPEKAKEEAALHAVTEAFFKDNVLLKKRFEKDPDGETRLKEGLMQLVFQRSRAYQTDPEALTGDPRFLKDLLIFSMEFEDQENARRAAGRSAA